MTLKGYLLSILDALLVPIENHRERRRLMFEYDDIFQKLQISTNIMIDSDFENKLDIDFDIDGSLCLSIDFETHAFIKFSLSNNDERQKAILDLDVFYKDNLLGKDIEIDILKEMSRKYVVEYYLEEVCKIIYNNGQEW